MCDSVKIFWIIFSTDLHKFHNKVGREITLNIWNQG